ncbi:MAG: hypothetical protein CME64_15650 [Halobacteriovoraceae bacterium]|nr:hypothetical protein [Halobacteriovoraceae bacterium]|tara:strand:+ start:180834 stop:181016 length:183 start_codon:yes stop_codon:yes gene_type:complete
MKKLFVINLFLAMFAVTGFANEVETDPGADKCATERSAEGEEATVAAENEEAQGTTVNKD